MDVLAFFLLHIVDPLQYAMDVLLPGLNAHAIRPADFQMTDRAPVLLSDVEQPVEDVVVVLRVQDDVVAAVEHRCRFGVDGATGAQEARIRGLYPRTVGAVDEALLSGIRDPVAWWSIVVVVLGFPGDA